MKKQVLTTLLLAILVCLSITADAQRARTKAQDGNPFHAIEQLKQELKLTQEQEKQMEALRKSFRKEAVAMRDQDFESSAARQSALQNLREGVEADLKAILTAEQLAVVENRQEARQDRQEEMRQALEDYQKTEIEPVMQAQRNKLEAKISEADKAQLETIRQEIQAKTKAYAKGKMKLESAQSSGQEEEAEDELATAEELLPREILAALVKKYDSDMEALFEEVKPQSEQWQRDLKQLRSTYNPNYERAQQAAADRGLQKPRAQSAPWFNKTRFLLRRLEATE